jgi:hypothetical protein
MNRRRAELALPEEEVITRPEHLAFPEDWPTDNTEFIVGDAQADDKSGQVQEQPQDVKPRPGTWQGGYHI